MRFSDKDDFRKDGGAHNGRMTREITGKGTVVGGGSRKWGWFYKREATRVSVSPGAEFLPFK